jgi:hypothetical protein
LRILLQGLTSAFLTLVFTASAHATVVRIETAGLLADQSTPLVQAAVRRAIATSMRGAAAIGLSTLRLDQAFVLSDRIVLQILATALAPAGAIRGAGSSGSASDP